MAAFIRGSMKVIASGHRATLGRLLNRNGKSTADADTSTKRHLHHDRGAKPPKTRPPRGRSHVSEDASTGPPADTRWVDSPAGLAALVADLRARLTKGGTMRSYIDTEADSLHHYSEKLCLIQLAVDDIFALIDTLSVGDLSGLLALLEDTEIWLHGADYDLTLLKRTYGWSPARICDTQIAARLCGERPFGLAALVERHCGVVLCKSSQKADWSQRPLSAKMQAYAIDDVRYLGRLADIFIRELTRRKRLAWFEQSCASLRSDVLKRPDRDREDAWRINGCGRLKPAGLALLRELWLWRDSAASERDVPPFKVLNNQQMLAIATGFEEHGRADHPPRWRSPWREGFHAAVERVRKTDPAQWPQQPRHKRRHITEAQKSRIEKLCALRDRKAEALGLESSLLGSRSTLEEVVLQTHGQDGAILMPWQVEVLELGPGPAATAA